MMGTTLLGEEVALPSSEAPAQKAAGVIVIPITSHTSSPNGEAEPREAWSSVPTAWHGSDVAMRETPSLTGWLLHILSSHHLG